MLAFSFAFMWRSNLIEFFDVYEGTKLEEIEHISVRMILLISLYCSLLLSFLCSLLDVFILKGLIGRRSLGQIILITAAAQILVIAFVIINANRFAIQLIFNADPRLKNNLWELSDLWYICILMLIVISFGRFIIEIDKKLGQGNLWLYLIGRFYKPHEERRIFMFLDLKSSTTIAEKIGHYKFSQLIQDCFRDLSVVERYSTEVYQYVGDEVVLTWPDKVGIKNDNYIKAFFAFQKKLSSKSKYYVKKYGIVPEFKAGVNVGPCTVAEVGELKREICYHGDTLNTAARVESLCNELDVDFLITEDLMQEISKKNNFKVEEKGNVELKGKVNKVVVYTVSK